jgi:hypothetical protein
LTDIQTSRSLVEVLGEMLSALAPNDRMALKEDVIIELVEQSRSYQRCVMQLVNTISYALSLSVSLLSFRKPCC